MTFTGTITLLRSKVHRNPWFGVDANCIPLVQLSMLSAIPSQVRKKSLRLHRHMCLLHRPTTLLGFGGCEPRRRGPKFPLAECRRQLHLHAADVWRVPRLVSWAGAYVERIFGHGAVRSCIHLQSCMLFVFDWHMWLVCRIAASNIVFNYILANAAVARSFSGYFASLIDHVGVKCLSCTLCMWSCHVAPAASVVSGCSVQQRHAAACFVPSALLHNMSTQMLKPQLGCVTAAGPQLL